MSSQLFSAVLFLRRNGSNFHNVTFYSSQHRTFQTLSIDPQRGLILQKASQQMKKKISCLYLMHLDLTCLQCNQQARKTFQRFFFLKLFSLYSTQYDQYYQLVTVSTPAPLFCISLQLYKTIYRNISTLLIISLI